MQSSLNSNSYKDLRQTMEEQQAWKDTNHKNVEAFREVLKSKDAFKVKYADSDSEEGLIEETEYLNRNDFQNLKNIDKYTVTEVPDPNDKHAVIDE